MFLVIIILGCISLKHPVAQNVTESQDRPKGIPQDFVELTQFIPGIIVDLKYHGSENFVGEPISGYTAHRCWMSAKAATQLKKVQDQLQQFDLSLKIFDAYRPQSAVDHFVHWSNDEKADAQKSCYYPHVDKSTLIPDGYIAKKSGHSRGSSIDLTIASTPSADESEAKELDMGTIFDFFGKQSWTKSTAITAQQRSNRLLLKALMEQHDFANYSKEWWHFRLREEPFPDTYFDFPTGGLKAEQAPQEPTK